MIVHVEGDLLEAKVDVIVQQCNTKTRKAHGLSASIAKRYPYADVYRMRSGKTSNTADVTTKIGSVVMCRPRTERNETGPVVACLMAQLAPGKPGAYSSIYCIDTADDSKQKRIAYFQSALDELASLVRDSDGAIKTVAFPYGIGCGLAGGDWKVYSTMIEAFARAMPSIAVSIYKLKD